MTVFIKAILFIFVVSGVISIGKNVHHQNAKISTDYSYLLIWLDSPPIIK